MDAPTDDIIEDPGGSPPSAAANEKQHKPSPLKYRAYLLSSYLYLNLKDDLNLPPALSDIDSGRIATLKLAGEIKTRIGSSTNIKIDGEAVYSTAVFDTGENGHDWAKFNEVFAEYYFLQSTSVLVGKYRRVYGPGLFHNPTDRHNSSKSLPGQSSNTNGAFMTQVNFQKEINRWGIGDIAMTVAYLPQYFENESGLPEKETTTTTLTDEGLEKRNVEWDKKDSGALLRLYGSVFKGDLNLYLYNLERDWQRGFSYVNFVTYWLEFHGEYLNYSKPHTSSLYATSAMAPFQDILVGTRIEPTEDYGLVLEYLNQGDRKHKFAPEPADLKSLMQSNASAEIDMSNLIDMKAFREYVLASLYYRGYKDTYSFYGNAIHNSANHITIWTAKAVANVGDTSSVGFMPFYVQTKKNTPYDDLIPFKWGATAEMQINF